MKKKRWAAVSIPCLWGILVLLLTLAERQSLSASIQTVGDALWYSLVTLTTVGYGDLFPVTFWGKVIGGIFVLLSVGMVAMILGFIVVLLTGRAMPKMQLLLHRAKPWDVFALPGKDAFVLAASLQNEERLTVCIGTKEQWPQIEGAVFFDGTVDEIIAYQNSGCRLFFFGDDEAQNYHMAMQYGKQSHPAYAACSYFADKLPSYVTLFDKTEACARLYWNHYPLKKSEQTVLLIGCENFGGALLEHGLISGVRGPKLPVHWHIFGEHAAWRTAHYQLINNLALAGFDRDGDSLTFHSGEWNADPKLVLNADRIILCSDSDDQNARLAKTIRRLYPTRAKLYVRMGDRLADETVFGTPDQLLSEKYVVQNSLYATAMTLHNIYRAGADYPVETWQELSDFKQRSNIAAADHIPTKLSLLLDDAHTAVTPDNCCLAYNAFVACSEEDIACCRQLEHIRWSRFHLLNNWRYDPVRNDELCCHPMLLPFDKLTLSEQQKDEYAWKLLEHLAKISPKEEV